MPDRLTGRDRRRRRIRKRIQGAPDRPRLAVFRSNKHIYAQVIDDLKGATLASASSHTRTADEGKVGLAKAVGGAIAAACLEKGIKRVVFDRAGYIYHGRIRALADAAREGGLEF